MGKKRVLVIGRHPIAAAVTRQYEAMEASVDWVDACTDVNNVDGYDELGVFQCVEGTPASTDSSVLRELQRIASGYHPPKGHSRKLLCHLLWHGSDALWRNQALCLSSEITSKFEVYAFTLQDQWAKNVICGMGALCPAYPPLDREPVTADSEKFVHLVIFGMGGMAESLALHAALTAHYPNYVSRPSLRTRITMVEKDITAFRDGFFQRYHHLFDNSHYRCLSVGGKCEISGLHVPVYASTREDFIDVEWEFIDAEPRNPVIQEQISQWAVSQNRILTLAFCYESAGRNLDEVSALPGAVYERGIPVLTYVGNTNFLDNVGNAAAYKNIYPFGMEDCGYDVRLPLLQMAKRLNYIYECSYGGSGIPTEIQPEEMEEAWDRLQDPSFIYSNIFNVMTIPTKMRSLGLAGKDWNASCVLNRDEMEWISVVEHNRWSLDRLLLGFRPPTESEREEIKENIEAFIRARKQNLPLPDVDLKKEFKKKKVHYDLCAYSELGVDATGKDVRVYDHDLTACVPLLARFYQELMQ